MITIQHVHGTALCLSLLVQLSQQHHNACSLAEEDMSDPAMKSSFLVTLKARTLQNNQDFLTAPISLSPLSKTSPS